MFDTLSDRLDKVFTSLRGKGRLSDADIDATAREIRIALLEADVALPVVKAFIGAVKERARGSEVSQALNPAQQVIKIVNEELVGILGGDTRHLRYAKTGPTVIMLAGLQGAGKTTLAGKLALWLKAQGHAPLLVACDLQRPNAVQQLQVVGGQAGADVFAPYPGSGVGDPVDAATRGIEHAKRMNHDVVVVDTAGRLGIDAEMMQQAADIRAAVQPDEVLFVVDAMIGQDAVVTAQAFQDGVGFTGVVLTKLDGDARGGAALSVRHLTGQPVMFASTGEKLKDFDVFHPERMASRILGMGDVLTLIEQAEKSFDADTAERMAGKMTSGQDFDLEDFLEQMMQVKKMGSLTSLLGMLPGLGGQLKEAISQVDDKDLDRIAAIIRSMTPQERRDPKILNGSRRTRIANGSGTTVTEVNGLVDRFYEAQKMMKQMGGMAGMAGLPGGGRKAKRQQAKQGKKKRGPGRAGGGPSKAGTPREPAPQQGQGLGQLPPGFSLPPGFGQPPANGPDPLGLRRPRCSVGDLDRLALVVDVQQGFADAGYWGRRDNPGCEDNVLALLGQWRERGRPVVLVRHDSDDPASPLHPGSPGNALLPGVDGPHDLLVNKSVNSSFLGTPDLDGWLRERGLDGIVVCGITTNHCCETTARMGGNLGHRVLFALDATHTFDRTGPDGDVVPAELLAKVTAANLDGEFATVVSTAELLAAG